MASGSASQMSVQSGVYRPPAGLRKGLSTDEVFLVTTVTEGGARVRALEGPLIVTLDVSDSMYLRHLPLEKKLEIQQWLEEQGLSGDGVARGGQVEEEEIDLLRGEALKRALPFAEPGSIHHALEGLRQAVKDLPSSQPLDLVIFSRTARCVYSGEAGDRMLLELVDSLCKRGFVTSSFDLGNRTHFSSGLANAAQQSQGRPDSRLFLVSDDRAHDADQARAVSRSLAAAGNSLACVGVGPTGHASLLVDLAGTTAGSYYAAPGKVEVVEHLHQELCAKRIAAYDCVKLSLMYPMSVRSPVAYQTVHSPHEGLKVEPCQPETSGVGQSTGMGFAQYSLGLLGPGEKRHLVARVMPPRTGVVDFQVGTAATVSATGATEQAHSSIGVGLGVAEEPSDEFTRDLILRTMACDTMLAIERADARDNYGFLQGGWLQAAELFRALGDEERAKQAEDSAELARQKIKDTDTQLKTASFLAELITFRLR